VKDRPASGKGGWEGSRQPSMEGADGARLTFPQPIPPPVSTGSRSTSRGILNRIASNGLLTAAPTRTRRGRPRTHDRGANQSRAPHRTRGAASVVLGRGRACQGVFSVASPSVDPEGPAGRCPIPGSTGAESPAGAGQRKAVAVADTIPAVFDLIIGGLPCRATVAHLCPCYHSHPSFFLRLHRTSYRFL